jgi:hypothetical protein
MKRCCVPACEDKTSRRYAIPSEQRIHAIWIERIGNPKLLGLDPKNLSRNYRVCKNHFAENCIDASDRLLRYALPTLNLHGKYMGQKCMHNKNEFVFQHLQKDPVKRIVSVVLRKNANALLRIN